MGRKNIKVPIKDMKSVGKHLDLMKENHEERGKMPKGRVKWFDENKGFGFIEQENGQDIFVHFSGIMDGGFKSLSEGDKVTFDVVRGPKGMVATKVKRI